MDNDSLSRFSDESLSASQQDFETYDQPEEQVGGNEIRDDGQSPGIEKPLQLSRESDVKFMDQIEVNNEKVRYYYNKTLCLRDPLANITEMLDHLHSSSFTYLTQLPNTGDYTVLSTLLELIPTISLMIDWDSQNNSCYWQDFCRETKQIMIILDKINGASLKCGDIADEVLRKAVRIFPELDESEKRGNPQADRFPVLRKENDDSHESANSQSVQISWQRSGDVIELAWHDVDGGLLNVSFSQTGSGFRLRFLRHLIYHANSLLDNAYLLFMKLNVALSLCIPVEKLMKCSDLNLNTLTNHERLCLVKAKREFDTALEKVYQTVASYKFHLFHLMGKYSPVFKKMRTVSFKIKNKPTFGLIKMNLNDSLLMRVMSSAITNESTDDSFDCTMFPDRTQDIIAKIEDMLFIDNCSLKELRTLLNILKIVWPVEKQNFTVKETNSTKDEIEAILSHRFQVRLSLKNALSLIDCHPAFNKMEKVRLSNVDNIDAFLLDKNNNPPSDEDVDGTRSPTTGEDWKQKDAETSEKVWITLDGGLEVTTDGPSKVLTRSPHNANVPKEYGLLNVDERVILTVRVIRRLLVTMANEHCQSKLTNARVSETKSLVKRLKIKDRQNVDLQNAIVEHLKYIKCSLHLTKSMRFLKGKA